MKEIFLLSLSLSFSPNSSLSLSSILLVPLCFTMQVMADRVFDPIFLLLFSSILLTLITKFWKWLGLRSESFYHNFWIDFWINFRFCDLSIVSAEKIRSNDLKWNASVSSFFLSIIHFLFPFFFLFPSFSFRKKQLSSQMKNKRGRERDSFKHQFSPSVHWFLILERKEWKIKNWK